ncbi:hypothetical protein R1flu_005969 [Riccia fluitans]|uniref:Ubiquitin-like protease family profile domain-containing protein n=1 Tax=Riccia fluitans TaxID=41844 RepID=A0ABD1YUN7_9MARC
MLSNILEHHGHANQGLASLEEDLAHAKLEEEKLKATIEALEKEKSKMNAKVALMKRKDLCNFLEAKMEGFQIANHPEMIGGFENLNLTITKKWVEIPTLNFEEFEKCPADYPNFVRGHRTFQDEVDRTGIDVCYQSLLKALKAATGTLPNSLAIFEYMRNPTTPDDAQASPDFEDLRTNERVRLRAEVRNLGAKPQWLTRSTRIRLEYEPTILPDVAPTDNPARPVTLDLTVDVCEDPSSLPQSQIVPVPTFVDLTQYISSPENEGSEDQGSQRRSYEEFHDEDMQGNLPTWIFVPIHGKNHWSLAIIRLHNDVAMLAHLDSLRGIHDPEAIFHVFKTVLCIIVPIDPALVMTAIMNVEQQQDVHSCEKHVLQMLAGAAKKELDGLDRCFREEGLIRYIATLDQVRSFDVVFGMYLSGKMTSPPM